MSLCFWLNKVWSLEVCRGICLVQDSWSQNIFHTLCSCFTKVGFRQTSFIFHTALAVSACHVGLYADNGTQVQQYLKLKSNIKISVNPADKYLYNFFIPSLGIYLSDLQVTCSAIRMPWHFFTNAHLLMLTLWQSPHAPLFGNTWLCIHMITMHWAYLWTPETAWVLHESFERFLQMIDTASVLCNDNGVVHQQ